MTLSISNATDSPPVDLESFRLRPDSTQPRKRTARHRPGQLFLKGPVPWLWLARAGSLPGKALFVGSYLWFLTGLKRPELVLGLRDLERHGVAKETVRRGLEHLERAGLVAVTRRRGRKARLRLLEPDELVPAGANDVTGRPRALEEHV
jgi:hypothetical protein